MIHRNQPVCPSRRGMIVLELLIVLLVLIGIGALAGPGLGFLMPGHQQRMQSNTNVRSIGTGLIMYGSTNNDNLPESLKDLNNQPGRESAALKKMIKQNIFDSTTLNNPRDRQDQLVGGVVDVDTIQAGTDYWILATDNNAYYNHNLSTVPFVGDKNTGTAEATASLWAPRGPWEGAVFWADGHTSVEESPLVDTKWPNTTAINHDDNLFSGDKNDTVLEMD